MGCGVLCRLVVLAPYGRVWLPQLSAHDVFDETPDQQRNQKDQTQRFNTLGSFQKRGIDDLAILEKFKVFLGGRGFHLLAYDLLAHADAGTAERAVSGLGAPSVR